MNGVVTEPALRKLLRLKLRGTLRRTWRRVRSPRGAILTLLGVGLVALWVFAIVASDRLADMDEIRALSGQAPRVTSASEWRENVRLGALVFVAISVGGAFVHRGLFLPQSEIERLFSAPLSRSDLVRYRLLTSVGRSLLGGMFFALLISQRLPHAGYGFVGALIAIQILPVVNQLLAILAGVLEGRLAAKLRVFGTVLSMVFGLLAVGVAVLVVSGASIEDVPFLSDALDSTFGKAFGGELAAPDWLLSATLVFEPWARMLTATNALDFATWVAACLALWLVLFELTARLPVDFRELSLETSANIAARLNRARRGGGAAAAKAKRGAAWVRIPWLLGRGPTRAIAWRKSTTILRKARGTIWISVIVLLFVTLLSSSLTGGGVGGGDEAFVRITEGGVEPRATPGLRSVEDLVDVLLPSLLIAFLGTLYLSGGLRFDFREDLDRMEAMRAWPIAPSRLFMSTLMPQVTLVSLLVLGAVALRVALTRDFHPALFGLAAFVPPFALAWVALDNAIFLFLPVRVVPGQGGMIPNAGRAFLVIFLRMLLLGIVLAIGIATGVLTQLLVESAWDVGPAIGLIAAATATWGALVLADVLLLFLGGRLLARFDVARELG